MAVSLELIREELLPGLYDALSAEMHERYSFAMHSWNGIYGQFEKAVSAPHIWVPKLSLPQSLALGAAAAIVRNPEVTRRFWAGWMKE